MLTVLDGVIAFGIMLTTSVLCTYLRRRDYLIAALTLCAGGAFLVVVFLISKMEG